MRNLHVRKRYKQAQAVIISDVTEPYGQHMMRQPAYQLPIPPNQTEILKAKSPLKAAFATAAEVDQEESKQAPFTAAFSPANPTAQASAAAECPATALGPQSQRCSP